MAVRLTDKVMRAAVWYGPSDLRLEERPIPDVVPGSLLIQVEGCAVCGSDLRIFREGNARIQSPRTIGHEIAGTVVAVGDDVTRFAVEDRISVGADIPCGTCEHCLAGRPNNCDINLAIGYQFEGGFADYILLDPQVVEAGPVHGIARHVAAEHAALAEPLACCLNGYELTHMRDGLTVAVFGAGPIGLMLADLAKSVFQASRVIVVEPAAARRAFAHGFGADLVIDPSAEDPVARIMDETAGRGVDRVFTACPVVSTHEQAVTIVAKRGFVNFFGGLPKSAPAISLSSNWLHYREAYVMGSHGSTPVQHARALALIEDCTIDASRYVTHRVPLERVEEAFRIAQSGEAIKVVVMPGRGAGEQDMS